MKIKKILVGAGIDLLVWFVACLVSIPIMAIALRIVNLFVVVTVPVAITVRLIFSIIAVCGVLGSISYLVSYHTASFSMGSSLLYLSIASVGRLLLSVLLKFYPFIAGGSQYLGATLFYSDITDMKLLTDLRLVEYVIAFLILTVLEIACFTVCGKLGEKNRIKARNALLDPDGVQ